MISPTETIARPAGVSQLRAGWLRDGSFASARGLAAGWRAAADHRALAALGEHRLRLRGLAPTDIPLEIHRRHFAALPGWRERRRLTATRATVSLR